MFAFGDAEAVIQVTLNHSHPTQHQISILISYRCRQQFQNVIAVIKRSDLTIIE